MNDLPNYDHERQQVKELSLRLAKVFEKNGMWPAAVVGGLVQAAGQFAQESGVDSQEIWRLVMEDMCRDQGVDPSVLDQD